MRPEILFPLFQDAQTLPGIGERMAQALEKRAGRRIVDMCWLLPQGLIDRGYRPQVAQLRGGEVATLKIHIADHKAPRQSHHPYVVLCHDDTGPLDLVFFHARPQYLLAQLPPGETRFVSGKVEFYRDQARMLHPAYIVKPEELEKLPMREAVYPSALGIRPRSLRKAMTEALRLIPVLPEWRDPERLRAHRWMPWHEALMRAHSPQTAADLDPASPARMRLAYDELLANQLALSIVRDHQRKRPGRAFTGGDDLQAKCIASLPWKLTGAQQRAGAEIQADMSSPSPMLRLLQGDVGSGKTIVALLAMLRAVGSGAQAAFMAPMELLARQHHARLQPLCAALGLRADLLIGRSRRREADAVLRAVEHGKTHILVGTHALFQERVRFHDLGLAVIDEQHRFGVHQKLRLSRKGGNDIDMLVMTATPIPRTLTMTLYGDMEVSRLDESPPGRLPIDTRALPLSRIGDVARRLRAAISQGARCFWVCPLVEELEPSLTRPGGKRSAARERCEWLKERFGARVGLAHGRLQGQEKDEVMQAFQRGDLDILVATTVVEVGIDVPEATIMVIEQAEQFGLAQLHQLRGRVGRGRGRSSCLLLYNEPLSDIAARRLRLLRESEDGFFIAEEDLRLRGSGEVLGTRQSGAPEFRLADPLAHQRLLLEARAEADALLAANPELEGEHGAAARTLLYLFERDEAIRYFRSG